MNDPINDLARRVYTKHKEVLDFIFENMPDPINEVYPLFEKKIIDAGYVIGSKGHGAIRFYTKEIDVLLPKEGTAWAKKESFSFEIRFGDKSPKFQTVITPGSQETQEIIHAALKKSKYYIKPGGKKWLVVFSEKIEFFKNKNWVEQSEEDIKTRIKDIVKQLKPIADDFHHFLINDDNVKRLK